MSDSIEARAEVVRVEAGRAWVRLIEGQSGCGRCHEPGGCGGTQLTDIFKGRSREYLLDDPLGLVPGERVKLVIGADVPLRMALSSYGLGTVLILLGGAVGAWLSPTAWVDLGVGVGAVVGGVLAGVNYRFLFRQRMPPLVVVRDTWCCGREQAGKVA
jgi:sigma-E factor negative regulatory protein RseC